MNSNIYELSVQFINDDSGRWDNQSIAFSKSIDTLKQKAVEDKRIFDQQWVTKPNGSIKLSTGDDYYDDSYTIKQITLI